MNQATRMAIKIVKGLPGLEMAHHSSEMTFPCQECSLRRPHQVIEVWLRIYGWAAKCLVCDNIAS